MRKGGLVLHMIITAAVGVGFYILGEVLLPVLTKMMWAPLGIALYFLLFGTVVYVTSLILCKVRGDYADWYKKNLGSVVSDSWKRAALGLAVLFAVSCLFEFVYELEKRNFTKPTSYVFVIDDSGSMSGSDPQRKRVDAIGEIMAKEDATFPYAVYRFTENVELVRDMAPYQQGEVIEFIESGGTDIVGALSKAIEDIKAGTLKGGTAPKILLLSDGESSDWGIDKVIRDCREECVVVSTISFGLSSNLLQQIAASTGGVYTEVQDVNLLQQEMESAVTSSVTRNLLSSRFVFFNDWLYAAMRIVFLILIGLVLSWIKQKCYCCSDDHTWEDKVFWTSTALCSVAAIFVESAFSIGILPGAIVRLVFCVLWAVIPGMFAMGGRGSMGGNGFDTGTSGETLYFNEIGGSRGIR